jgi:hypothetical protein
VSTSSVTITAGYGGVSGSTTLTVTSATLVSIGVTPASPRIAKGTAQQFTATGVYSDATIQDLTGSATWTSSDPTVATISSQGKATGVAVSTTPVTITARFSGVSGSTALTVTSATLASIGVTPATSSIAKGTSQQFTAVGTYTDDTSLDLTDSVTWSSSDAAVASISNASGSRGKATGAAVGGTAVTIYAAAGSIRGTATLAVTAAVLTSVEVTPALPSIPKGTTLQFTATGVFSDGTTQALTDTAAWTPGDSSTATLSNASGSHGLAVGLGAGSTTVTATSGGIPGSTTLTVTAALTCPDGPVSVTTTDAWVAGGQTLTIDATALTGTNTLIWDGSAETDGAFYIEAGSSAATLTGGAGNDTFDFTASGVVFSSADSVNGGAGSDTLKIGKVTTTTALAKVTNVETLSFANQASVAITTPDSLVASGAPPLIVDASALTGDNTFTWDGSAETDGAFNITSGSSNATITGGSGNDTITVGRGTNVIDGGAGTNTITLGKAGGTNTIVFRSLGDSIKDIVSNFSLASDTLGLKANADGGKYITRNGGLVSSSTPPEVAIEGGYLNPSSAVLTVLSNPIADDAALAISLANGGTNRLTLGSGANAGSDLLFLYGDGTDAHLVTVRLTAPDTSFSSDQMKVIDMATLSGAGNLSGLSYTHFLIY